MKTINEKYEVYNPHEKNIKDLPIIYGFNNGGSINFLHGQLIAEDGTALGSHLCSSEGYMLGDLGILKGFREDRHEGFKKHYPDGYRMDFVKGEEVENHEGIKNAFELNQKAGESSEETTE